jgi:diphthamide synthase (EF-2-diphthine--ammonia ligase)
VVVTTDDRHLAAHYCGRRFDRAFVAGLPAGVDPCGENGEFHTFVTGGEGFAAALRVTPAPPYAHQASFAGAQAGYHVAPLRIAAA